MASYQFSINNSDQAQNFSYTAKSSGGCGRSKAQLCLQKILHIIRTIPPEPTTPSQPSSISSVQSPQNETTNEDKCFIPDLNVENFAVPPQQAEDPQSPALAADEVFEQEKVEVLEEISSGFCENNNKVISFDHEDENEGDNIINQGEDCMGLLIEAAKMILGEFKTEEKQILEDFEVSTANTRPEIKRKKRWTTVDLYAQMEPVVRSKRGRTQVLPCKFRDSVLEPLTRARRTRSTIIATKRRLG